ncbi:MAG: glutamate racemase [Candidatus Omnitrophica bacterium]|nr:glutamate racemase [Candidatus Omnitrophota bacterium]
MRKSAKNKRYSPQSPIGIFDSGVGGLTVFKEIERLLPGEHIVYMGDTARVPYGNKSPKTVVRFSTENVLFLLENKVKLVVVACNTSSSLALDFLQKTFSVPIVGVIDPAVEKAVEVSPGRRIGVIGTKSTIKSGVYQKKILQKDSRARVCVKACPLFVPLVEEAMLSGPITEDIARYYLKGFKGGIDTLILGCTHYPLLKKIIASYLKDVHLINSAYEVAVKVRGVLRHSGLLNPGRRGRREFFVSDEPAGFMKLARLFLNKTTGKPKVINV